MSEHEPVDTSEFIQKYRMTFKTASLVAAALKHASQLPNSPRLYISELGQATIETPPAASEAKPELAKTLSKEALLPESIFAPPSILLLDLFLSPDIAKDSLANLEDVFPLWCERHGIRRARWIFRLQTIFIIVGNRGAALLSFFERVAKLARLTG